MKTNIIKIRKHDIKHYIIIISNYEMTILQQYSICTCITIHHFNVMYMHKYKTKMLS